MFHRAAKVHKKLEAEKYLKKQVTVVVPKPAELVLLLKNHSICLLFAI